MSTIDTVYLRAIQEDYHDAEWKFCARAGKKVDAIKSFRNTKGCDLYTAKRVVEMYLETISEQGTRPAKVRTITLGATKYIVTEAVPGFYTIKETTERDLGTVSENELLQFIADTVIRNGHGMPTA